MSFEFFATPIEQRNWFINEVVNKNVWLFGWSFQRKYIQIKTSGDIEKLSFEAKQEDDLIIYMGLKELSQPVWQLVKGKKTLDFINSQAIQFVPSLIVGNILLQGRLGISRNSIYKINKIDPVPLERWLRKLRKSWASMMSKKFMIVQKTTNGELKEWHGIGITEGAIDWHIKGGLLKQFPLSAVELNIKRKHER